MFLNWVPCYVVWVFDLGFGFGCLGFGFGGLGFRAFGSVAQHVRLGLGVSGLGRAWHAPLHHPGF